MFCINTCRQHSAVILHLAGREAWQEGVMDRGRFEGKEASSDTKRYKRAGQHWGCRKGTPGEVIRDLI